MSLTDAQLITLKADIAANADTNTIPMGVAGDIVIRDLYNAATTTDVWQTNVSVNSIYDAIDFTKYTPVDAATENLIGAQRLLIIQTKQMNLQNMLQGRTNIDASKANIRNGIKDAVTALPAGTSGALISASGSSGVNVLTAMTRKANRIEKLFATVPATTGTVTANLIVYEGSVTTDDITAAREHA